MRNVFVIVAAALLSSVCALQPGDGGVECSPLRMVPSPLVVGDSSLDRGYPGGVSLVDVDGDRDLDLMATRGYNVVAPPAEPRVPERWRHVHACYRRGDRGQRIECGRRAVGRSGWRWRPDLFIAYSDLQRRGNMDPAPGEWPVIYRNQGGWRFARIELAKTGPDSPRREIGTARWSMGGKDPAFEIGVARLIAPL